MIKRAKQSLPTRLLIKGLDLIVPLGLICLELILNLLCVGTAVNGILLLLFITSPLWISLLVCWWPMFIIIVCILRFSSLRTYINKITTEFALYLLYNYQGRHRKNFWDILYTLLSFGLPNNIVA